MIGTQQQVMIWTFLLAVLLTFIVAVILSFFVAFTSEGAERRQLMNFALWGLLVLSIMMFCFPWFLPLMYESMKFMSGAN